MGETIKTVFLVMLLIGLCLSFAGLSTASEPTIENIDYTPKNPAPLSIVTFNAEISGDDISEVRLIVDECNENSGTCYYPSLNVSMSWTGANMYQAEVTLQHEKATIVKYHLVIDGERYPKLSTDDFKFDLVPVSNGGDTGNDDESKGTPGFEILILLSSIIIVTFYMRKRAK